MTESEQFNFNTIYLIHTLQMSNMLHFNLVLRLHHFHPLGLISHCQGFSRPSHFHIYRTNRVESTNSSQFISLQLVRQNGGIITSDLDKIYYMLQDQSDDSN